MIGLFDVARLPRNDMAAVRALIELKGWPRPPVLVALARLQDDFDAALETLQRWESELNPREPAR